MLSVQAVLVWGGVDACNTVAIFVLELLQLLVLFCKMRAEGISEQNQ